MEAYDAGAVAVVIRVLQASRNLLSQACWCTSKLLAASMINFRNRNAKMLQTRTSKSPCRREHHHRMWQCPASNSIVHLEHLRASEHRPTQPPAPLRSSDQAPSSVHTSATVFNPVYTSSQGNGTRHEQFCMALSCATSATSVYSFKHAFQSKLDKSSMRLPKKRQ